MRWAVAFALWLGLLLTTAGPAHGDDARPAVLTLREAPAGTFHVRWQTPMRGRMTMRLQPELPADAAPIEGSYNRVILGDALVETWLFTLPGGLEERKIGVAGGALLARGVDVIVRTSLASGATPRALLSSRRPSFVVPAPAVEVRVDRWQHLAAAADAGWRLGLTWIHILLAFLVVAAAGVRGLGWGLGGFLVADLVGRSVPLERASQEFGLAFVAVAAMLLAREALLGRRTHVVSLAIVAGICHGLSTPASEGGLVVIGSALGLDAAHCAVGLLALLALRLLPLTSPPRWLLATAGVLACSLALGGALAAPASARPAASKPVSPMALLAGERLAPGGPMPGAARSAVEGLEFYVDIGVFQTRVEVLARWEALRRWLEIEPESGHISVALQSDLLARIASDVRERVSLHVDGIAVGVQDLGDVRAGFTTQDGAGVYLRDAPVDEAVADAVVGVVLSRGTSRLPSSVRVEVLRLPRDAHVRARILDPEVTREVLFSVDAPLVAWKNTLREDPLPPIESLTVAPAPVTLPLFALLAFLVAFLGLWGLRVRTGVSRSIPLRVGLFLFVFLASTGTIDAPGIVESAPEPSHRQQRTITATLLDNIYRAFNERDEEQVYDRLALSLTGDQLEHVYVENRRLVDAQRFGGARAHVDVVDLRTFDLLTTDERGDFRARVGWTVAGSVTHFGHRHLRRNRYQAVCLVGPEHGVWKVLEIDHESTEREK